MIQIFLADGRKDGSIRGSRRGPRGPKNTLYISRLWENSDEQSWDKQNKTKITGKVDVTYKDKNAHSEF